jgi:N-formylglutamate amidohydrolase
MIPFESSVAIAPSSSVCPTPAPMFRTIFSTAQCRRPTVGDTDWHIDRLYDGLLRA